MFRKFKDYLFLVMVAILDEIQSNWLGFMVLNATLNIISVILWQSVLLVEETGVPEENHRPVASH
jgi:hypothetical protein